MRKHIIPFLTAAAVLVSSSVAFAGNPQRAGSNGAEQLLINPWARSAGMAGANQAHAKGLEGIFLNVAGIAHTRKTELMFVHTNYWADISINAFGFTQKVGEDGVLGFSVMSMDIGEIPLTTTDNPDGDLGTYSPSLSNIGVSYAKKFTETIYGGVTVKVISESIPNLSSTGVAFDAGIQYVTGANKEIRFGIALKNVGPTMSFNGDGLTFRVADPGGDGYTLAAEQRSQENELPALIKIGGSYDFIFEEASSILTLAGNFTSNAFKNDEFQLGVMYNFRGFLMLRGGYLYEDGITSEETSLNAYAGPHGGLSIEFPLGSNGTTFSVDYGFRAVNRLSNLHTFGARINL